MNSLILVAALATAPPADPPTAAEAVRLALKDARTLNPVVAGRTRYLSAHNAAAADPAKLPAVETVLKGLIPSLSRGTSRAGGLRAIAAVPVRGAKAPAAWLWAVDLEEYGMDPIAFANLSNADPYFHTPSGDPTKPAAVPEHLPALEYQELAARVQSLRPAPIFRADWLIYRASAAAGRAGDGYYDFLGLKSVADVERLAGLDRGKAEALDSDRRAVIQRSGPGANHRQLIRYEAANGPAWRTQDPADNAGGNNALVRLDQAGFAGGMTTYTLPNRLTFSALFAVESREGGREKLLDVAPANIAADRTAAHADLQIHPGRCWGCHKAGNLSPFTNEVPAVYHAGNPFRSLDAGRSRRVKAVFFGADEIETLLEEDQTRHDRAMIQAAGVGYREWGRMHKAAVAEYESNVDLPTLAAEAGLTPAALRRALVRFRDREGFGSLNPALGLYLADGASARREFVEDVFPLLMAVIRQELR